MYHIVNTQCKPHREFHLIFFYQFQLLNYCAFFSSERSVSLKISTVLFQLYFLIPLNFNRKSYQKNDFSNSLLLYYWLPTYSLLVNYK